MQLVYRRNCDAVERGTMRITSVSITPLPNWPIPLCREWLLFAPLLPQWPDGQFREGAKRHASFVSKIHVVWSRNSSFWRSLSRDPTARACASHRNPREILFTAVIISLCNDITHGAAAMVVTSWQWHVVLEYHAGLRKTWKFADSVASIESDLFSPLDVCAVRRDKIERKLDWFVMYY